MKTDNFPMYAYPTGTVVGLALAALLGLHRDFREDALACIQHLQPPLQVTGIEHLPHDGACVLTVNHYHRPGFGAEWLALAITAVVPRDIHWIMTGEWTAPDTWYEPFKGAYSRWLLKRLARVYGFTTMPPMPPRSEDVEARARSVRRVLAWAKRTPGFVLGLAPEGADQTGGQLTVPASGLGRFGLLLAGLKSAFVPIGAYEADGVFHLRFGPSYQLRLPPGLSTEEKDRQAAHTMMERIAPLLPESLRGEFA